MVSGDEDEIEMELESGKKETVTFYGISDPPTCQIIIDEFVEKVQILILCTVPLAQQGAKRIRFASGFKMLLCQCDCSYFGDQPVIQSCYSPK